MDYRFGDLCIAAEKKKTGEPHLQEASQKLHVEADSNYMGR